MANNRYLTKSRFRIGSDCESRLYYTGKRNVYADQSAENPFMIELAKGGYQVGELAKYYFFRDRPVPTINEIDYERALKKTDEMISSGESHIAEAAFRHENLFIRVDIFSIDRESRSIRFYEVKAKSWDGNTEFTKNGRVSNEWKPYLMDAAFQKHVISMAWPGYSIGAYLMLVNKDSTATVDGLNQLFRIEGDTRTFKIYTDPGLSREKLGEEILVKINVDEEVDLIRNTAVESISLPGVPFEQYITLLSDAYKSDRKISAPLTKACRDCPFYTKPGQEAQGLRSGLKECWMEKLQIGPEMFERPKIIELWGGRTGARSVVQDLLDRHRYFLQDIEEAELPGNGRHQAGLSPRDRRWKQIEFVRRNDKGFYFDREGFSDEMTQWRYPLHFIDFETSMPALPFNRGAHPYEGIAFQFSHHILHRNGRIEHKSQYLDADRGVNPNLGFIRALRHNLSSDDGTIFRYHNHENTYLRFLHDQLTSLDHSHAPDRVELLAFIDSITKYRSGGSEVFGERCMYDMYELVLRYYYSPFMRGSNSLKSVMPAAINDSRYLREKYSRPVCGYGREVSSLNFAEKIWIDQGAGNDPYKTLPKVFEDYDRETLDGLFSGLEEVADGGAAMMAYARLQFFDTPEDQREAIKSALLKYCELDTLAMVMLMEFWMNESER